MEEQLKLWDELNENKSLREVQNYVNNVNEIRGFNSQEITKTMLLLRYIIIYTNFLAELHLNN